MSADKELNFRFMKRRSAEAAEMSGGAIYVDWGDRNEGPFFDHHALTERTCSTSLVNSAEGMARLQEQVASAKAAKADFQIVTHSSPDLDSVGAACTVARVMRGNTSPLHDVLVDYILAKDQGREVGENPARSIALLFQAIKNECSDDQAIMAQGIALLEAVDQAIRQRSFRPGWNNPCDIPGLGETALRLQTVLERNGDALRRILAHAPRTLLSIPTETENGTRRFTWVDGIVLDFTALESEPLGWKEYVRHDVRSSMHGQGYLFTAVASKKRGRENFIISVDPGSGLSLEGLGATLEAVEQRESLRLDKQPDTWPDRLTGIANNRNPSRTPPTLIRDTKAPRDGYENADPWYDGRGHGFTIVDTPESGTVLEQPEVLKPVLGMYDPLWAETVIAKYASLFECNAAMETRQASMPEWLRTASGNWRVDPAGSSRVPQPAATGTVATWADILESLASRPVNAHRYALYLPVRPYPSQLLPESERTLYLQLALYLAMHGQTANAPGYPQSETLAQWSSEFVWRPLPGVWCAVSERGAIMADYARGADAVPADFLAFRDDCFALVKQLGWTQTLSRSVRDKQRFEALRDFSKRSAAG